MQLHVPDSKGGKDTRLTIRKILETYIADVQTVLVRIKDHHITYIVYNHIVYNYTCPTLLYLRT